MADFCSLHVQKASKIRAKAQFFLVTLRKGGIEQGESSLDIVYRKKYRGIDV